MNHPTREEMMEHLYGECSPAQQATLEAHLRACAECREQSGAWQSTMRTLDSWRLPARRHFSLEAAQPALRWAAAAIVLLSVTSLAFLAGRGPSQSASAAAIQATVRQEVAAQVATAMARERATLASELRAAATESASQESRQLLASFAEQLDERRQADAEVFYNAIQQFDARNSQSISRLRRDLSTVAVVADARLLDAQEQILELANNSLASQK